MRKVLVSLYSWENPKLYSSDAELAKGDKVVVASEYSNEIGIVEDADVDTAENPKDKIIVPQQHDIDAFLVVPTSFCMGCTGDEKITKEGLCIWYTGLGKDMSLKSVIEPLDPDLKRNGLISAFSGYIPEADMKPFEPVRNILAPRHNYKP